MDTAVAVVTAYLELCGYFVLTELPVRGRDKRGYHDVEGRAEKLQLPVSADEGPAVRVVSDAYLGGRHFVARQSEARASRMP